MKFHEDCSIKSVRHKRNKLLAFVIIFIAVTGGCPPPSSTQELTVSISSTAPQTTDVSPIPVIVVFSASVNDFAVSDLVLSKATVSDFAGSGKSYSFDLVPTVEDLITVTIPAGVATDSNGTKNKSAQLARYYDISGLPPNNIDVTISSTAQEHTNVSPIPITVDFSASVDNFIESDLIVSNADISDFTGSGASYSFNLDPTAEDLITVTIPAGSVSISADVFNKIGVQLTRYYDVTGPRALMETTSEDYSGEDPLFVTVTFTELVNDFDASDINATNATVSNFEGTGTEYSFDLLANGEGKISASISVGAIPDMAGNVNSSVIEIVTTISDTPPLTIYVSSSDGDDSFDGLSESKPKKTIAAGYDLLRTGIPDTMLLKRGDIWTNEKLAELLKSGLSKSKHLTFFSYGTSSERPLLRYNDGGNAITILNDTGVTRHVTVKGLHFKNEGTIMIVGISILGVTKDFVIDDCYVEGFKTNISAQAYIGPVEDFTIKNSVIIDAYSKNHDAHSQGLYCGGVSGMLIENCLFDHNGWKEGVTGSEPTIFNHNMYISNGCSDVIVRNNLICRASSHGLQLRCGGIIEGNLLVRNPIGILLGGGYPLLPSTGVTGSISGNVVIEAEDIANYEYTDRYRGEGIGLANISPEFGVSVTNNIVANEMSQGGGNGYTLSGHDDDELGYTGIHKLEFDNNIAYNCGRTLQIKGELLSDMTISNSVFQVTDATSLMIFYFNSLDIDADIISYQNNTWYSNSEDHWFTLVQADGGGGIMEYDEWQLLSEETGKKEEVEFFEPSRNLDLYNYEILEDSASVEYLSFDSFIENARKYWGDSRYSASEIINYIREGFVIGPAKKNPVHMSTFSVPQWQSTEEIAPQEYGFSDE